MPRIFLDCEAADLEAFAQRIQTIRKNERLLSMPAYNLFEQYEKFVLSLAKRAREEDEAQGKKAAPASTGKPVADNSAPGPAPKQRRRRSSGDDGVSGAERRLDVVVGPVASPVAPAGEPARRPRGRPRKVVGGSDGHVVPSAVGDGPKSSEGSGPSVGPPEQRRRASRRSPAT